MHSPDNRNPLIAYLDGTASAQERRQVERWMNLDPANRQLLDKLRATPDPASALEGFTTSAFRRIPAGPPADALESDGPHDFEARPLRGGPLLLAARFAATLLLLVPIYFLFQSKISALFDTGTGAWVETHSPAGETRVVTLPDGSRVLLYEDSRLRHRPGSATEVFLDGMAAFEVHRAGQPLLVHVGQAEIQAQDAAFEVRELPAGEGIELVVDSGELAFARKTGDSPLFIRSPQRMTYAYRETAQP